MESFRDGGPDRVKWLDGELTKLGKHSELIVCSKGIVAPIRFILWKTGLLKHFTMVYARKNDYDVSGKNAYDVQANQFPFDTPIQENCLAYNEEAFTRWLTKTEVCFYLGKMKRPACLVEDDPNEVQKAENAGFSACFVSDMQGVTPKEMTWLAEWQLKRDNPIVRTSEEPWFSAASASFNSQSR